MVLSSIPGPVLIYKIRILIFKLRASLHIGGWWPKRRSQVAQRSPKDRPRSTFQQLPNGIHASSKQFRRSTVNHTYMKTPNFLRNQTCETTRNPYCTPMYKSSFLKHMEAFIQTVFHGVLSVRSHMSQEYKFCFQSVVFTILA